MRLRNLLFAVAFLFAIINYLGLVGQMDYQSELDAEAHYAEMVCGGHWPDYKNRNPDCEDIENRRIR